MEKTRKKKGLVCSKEHVELILINSNVLSSDCFLCSSLTIYTDDIRILSLSKYVEISYLKIGVINITDMQLNIFLSPAATKSEVSVSEFRRLCRSAGVNNTVITLMIISNGKLRNSTRAVKNFFSPSIDVDYNIKHYSHRKEKHIPTLQPGKNK